MEFDQAALNWFKMSTAPTEFKLIAGEDGREFLFCIPDVDDVDVAPVERTGRRTIGMTVKPRTVAAEAQTNEVRVREDDSVESAAEPVEVEDEPGEDAVDVELVDGNVEAVAPEGSDDTSSGGTVGSGNNNSSGTTDSATTVSSATAADEMEEFRAGVELTK